MNRFKTAQATHLRQLGSVAQRLSKTITPMAEHLTKAAFAAGWDAAMALCPLAWGPCETHAFVHGGEAEELRKGVELLIQKHTMVEDEDDYRVAAAVNEVLDAFEALLAEVDARDSVAWREAHPKKKDGGAEGYERPHRAKALSSSRGPR